MRLKPAVQHHPWAVPFPCTGHDPDVRCSWAFTRCLAPWRSCLGYGQLTGTFQLMATSEYDANLALVHMKDAQVLYQMGENSQWVTRKIDNLDEAPAVQPRLTKALGFDGYVTDWTRLDAIYFPGYCRVESA